jgi:hypothetical protein
VTNYERVRYSPTPGALHRTIILRDAELAKIAGYSVLAGVEVDRAGNELAPRGVDERRHLIDLALIVRRTKLVTDNHYAELREETP